jgi:hypothetical protein
MIPPLTRQSPVKGRPATETSPTPATRCGSIFRPETTTDSLDAQRFIDVTAVRKLTSVDGDSVADTRAWRIR